MASKRTTTALVQRAVAAFQATGLEVGAVELLPGGRVRVVALSAIQSLESPKGENTCDGLFADQN